MTKVLITGALGHIGSKLIHSLKPEEFEEIHMIDNFLCQRYVSLFNLPSGITYRFFEDDICEADFDSYLSGIDVVIHLAAITDAATSHEKRDEVERVNYLGTKRIAEACIRNNCKIIFPSTTSVYGVQSGIVNEECPERDLKPQSPYAETKLQSEQLLRSLGSQGLKFVICRFGTIFGTSVGMRFHTAVNKFCWQASMGLPISVWRTALNQERPYLGLNDAISSIKFIISEDLFNNTIYNVVTVNTTVNRIIEEIKRTLKDVNIQFVDTKIMNQLSYSVAAEKSIKAGFTYSDKIEEGISETLSLLSNAHNRI